MSEVLPRVAWSVGQVLLPEHFRALEASLIAEATVRNQIHGLPPYGLLALEWNGPSPRAGVVEVTAARWVTPQGALVDLPGNARPPRPMALAPFKRPLVEVYLHLLDERPDESSPVEPAAPAKVPRVVHRLALAADVQVEGSRGYVKLGDLTRSPGGAWGLARAYMPPLLGVVRTGYLVGRLQDLRVALEGVERVFEHRNLSPGLTPEQRVTLGRARLETRRLAALLGDVFAGGVDLHPYLVFRALRDYLLEVERLEAVRASPAAPTYEHDHPGRCFGRLLDLIEAQLAAQPRVTEAIRFDREVLGNGETWMVCRHVPDAVLAAQDFYLLVQKPSADAVVPLRDATLAAPGRLAHALEYRLTTLPLHQQADSPLSRNLGASVDVYYIDAVASPEEWRHVLGERAIALYAGDLDADAQVYLYWSGRAEGQRAP